MESKYDYVVFDIETTGLHPDSDQICEIAAIGVKDGLPQGLFSTLVAIEGYFIYCKAIDVSGNYSGELVSETVGPVKAAKKGEIQSIATSSDDIVGQVLITSHGEVSNE